MSIEEVFKKKLNECNEYLMLLVDQEMKDKGNKIKCGIYVLHYNFYDHDCMISFDMMNRKWVSALIQCVEPITVENNDNNPWGYFEPVSEDPMKSIKEYNMSLWNKDKEIIRNAFKTYSKTDLHPCDYEQAIKSMERMHANFFLKYCKAQGYNRQKTIDLYTANHSEMISFLNTGMDIQDFTEDE